MKRPNPNLHEPSPGLVVVSADQLRELIREEVRAALGERSPEAPAEWLDTRAAAALLGVHPASVRQLVTRSGLPASRLGRAYRLRRSDVLAWLGERR